MITELLHSREKQGNYRRLKTPKSCIDFASNDYLGLARSDKLKKAFFKEWRNYEKANSSLNGLGSTGARLLTGNSQYAETLEEFIAHYHGFPAALLFTCGYMANVGLLSSLINDDALILFDTHVHASTYDGMALSPARSLPFRHNDPDHLEARLKKRTNKGDVFVCIDSIYSLDGSIAPLSEVSTLCATYSAKLLVDEAHAVGLFGNGGQGLMEEKEISPLPFAKVIGFGKAFGCFGAAILGSLELKHYLINFARPFIYTTAPPFSFYAAIKSAYGLLPSLDKERAHVKELISFFQKSQKGASSSQIQQIVIPGNENVKKAEEHLRTKGFDARSLMHPSVRKGKECLRVCLHAFNTEKEILGLLNAL